MHNNSNKLITRFAPSPTGYLHLGHVLSIAYVFGIARQLDAKVLLRIEDHDRQRCRKEYETAIIDDLAWLGFFTDNWTELTQYPTSIFRQSDNLDRYQNILDKWWKNDILYYCQCSRKKILESSGMVDNELRYPGICRYKGLQNDQSCTVRLKVPDTTFKAADLILGMLQQNPQKQSGDFALRDLHQNYTYNFAVAVDDVDQHVNLVIRGQDLTHCTGRQVFLRKVLGSTEKCLFAHHPLIVDPSGKKLSKRLLSEGIIQRRLRGEPPEQVLGEALYLGGLTSHLGPVKPANLDLIFRHKELLQ